MLCSLSASLPAYNRRMRRWAYISSKAIFLFFVVDVGIKLVRNQNAILPLIFTAIAGAIMLFIRFIFLRGREIPEKNACRNPNEPPTWK